MLWIFGIDVEYEYLMYPLTVTHHKTKNLEGEKKNH